MRRSTSRLSPREREVLRLLSMGLLVKQVAVCLRIKPRTVESYVRTAREKLSAPNITAAVARAVRDGDV